VFVYDGHFRIPLASALALAERADGGRAKGELPEAERDAREAVALAPTDVRSNTVLGDILAAQGRAEDARPFYEAARQAARTIAPDFQVGSVAGLEAKLKALGPRP